MTVLAVLAVLAGCLVLIGGVTVLLMEDAAAFFFAIAITGVLAAAIWGAVWGATYLTGGAS